MFGMSFRKMIMVTAALVGAISVFAADSEHTSDVESWNEGVGYYRDGDVTNALRVLRPLTLSKTHGARAAEIVSKLELERGNREEAAVNAQIALRANPKDERVNRNFTRAVDGLAAERERKRVESVLKAAEGKDAGSMLGDAMRRCRKAMDDTAKFRKESAEQAVEMSDRLSAELSSLADCWLPLRELIANSVTNEEQAATIMAQLDEAEKKTRTASAAVADFDDGAYAAAADSEHDFTRFFKLTAMPPMALAEDLVAQSNAWQDVAPVNGRSWQQDALDYTQAFRAKFPAWARDYEQRAQADTNMPPFTAEDQYKVAALATQLEKIQIECVEKMLPPKQEEALGIISQIRELLPPEKGNGGQQGAQGQNNQKPPPQDNSDQQNQNNNQQDQQQDQQQNQDQDKQDQQAEEQQESKEDQNVESILRKAQERSDEHEAEKRARMRKSALPPNERDW